MFKSTAKTNDTLALQTPTLTSTGTTCLISKGTSLEGKFSSSENVQINGTIKGEVVCKQQLFMGPTGWIEGTIHTQSATIKGYIKGTLIVKEVLKLESTAKIDGVIIAKTLQVESGAQYSGDCKIGERFIKDEKQLSAVA